MANILVVDDRAINREFLAMLLGYADHRVFEATDGGAGLEMARQLRPDLIISDIVMPKMDGVDFARSLRADAEIGHVPLIFYTASYRLREARKIANSCGVSAVISKPSKPRIILDAVAAALGVPATPVVKLPVLAKPSTMGARDLGLSLRLSMLIELGLELTEQRDPQRLLDLACEASREIFCTQYAAVGIVNEETGRLSRYAARGFADEAGGWFAALDPRSGILGAVVTEGKPRRVQGLAGKGAASGLPAGHPPIDSLLLVPLVSAMRSYGWFYVANRTGGEAFGDADEQIATTLAAKLTLAYENLLLYDTLQHYAARLEEDSEAIKQLNAGLEQEVKARQISETRFRLAMEAGTTLAYTMDRDLRYTWAHSCRRGFDEQTVLGKTAFDLFTEETARSVTALYRQAIGTGEGLRRDVIVRTLAKPLIQRQFELIIEPTKDADGEVTGIICAAVDITERKQVEEALRAAKGDAERANNAKSRFLAAASHDLRQPLAALNLYVDIMLRSTRASTDGPQLQNMKACITSLSEMLADLLDLSKLESGVVAPDVSDFSLGRMLGTIISVHAPEAQAKGLELRYVATGLIARTDPAILGRVVGNFVANAVRYTERGGVLIACRRRYDKMWIEVWDTGIGIPEDKTTEIFEEFRQLGNNARHHSKGSGLGLAIAAKSAALLGLQIRVRSRLGRGSVFAVEVPLGQDVVTAMTRETTSRPLRIALVEDDPRVVEALALALTSMGHQVVAAASGRELLARLDGAAPDILISDYRLADRETGFDVVSSVRTAFGKDVPALVVTGDTDPKLMRSMADKGIHIAHKPLDVETLQSCIAKLVEREVSMALLGADAPDALLFVERKSRID